MRRLFCLLSLFAVIATGTSLAKVHNEKWIALSSDKTAASGQHPVITAHAAGFDRISLRAYRVADPVRLLKRIWDSNAAEPMPVVVGRDRAETIDPLDKRIPDLKRGASPIVKWDEVLDESEEFEDWRESDTTLYSKHDIPVPVTEKGVYLIEASQGRWRAYTVVIVTDIVAISRAAGNQTHVFVADRSTGAPIPGCDVVVIADRETRVRTNEHGVLTLAKTQPKSLIALKGEDVAVIASVGFWNENDEGGTAYLYTDRPIYRPGDTAHFKALLRGRTENRLTVPKDETVKLTVNNPKGEVLFEKELQTSKIDMTEPLPDGLDLLAEVLLANDYSRRFAPELSGYDYSGEAAALFRESFAQQLAAVRAALQKEDREGWMFPRNQAELVALFRQSNIDPDGPQDPWGTNYRFGFGVEERYRTVSFTSAGPDKVLGTPDDIAAGVVNWKYFTPVGKEIDRAVKEAHARSAGFVRDLSVLRTEVLKHGIDLEGLRDPWGRPYRFEFAISGSYYRVIVKSQGQFVPQSGNDNSFTVWTSSIDYFADVRRAIDEAVVSDWKVTGRLPRSDADFDKAVTSAGVDFRSLADPWGNPYRVTYTTSHKYSDSEEVRYRPDLKEQQSTPVTQALDWVTVWSNGQDGKLGTEDDFVVATFSQAVAEQSGRDMAPVSTASVPLSGATGAIQGIVTDQTGAIIPNAQVLAKSTEGSEQHSAKTGPDGAYVLRNLKPGRYHVEVFSAAFMKITIRDVPVQSAAITAVNVVLRVGSTTETVEVQAATVEVSTMSSATVMERKAALTGKSQAEVAVQKFTPRVRDFFPETLYWAPSVITDSSGKSRVKFKLADNITTWKMSVLASTQSGEIGTADAEIQSFQPFFIEHDPPKILTVGDEIELPVVVRNYLNQEQNVDVEMKPADWFTLLQDGKNAVVIPAGEYATASFPFRSIAPVREGKQRVTAANRNTGDAIERPVLVHPDGKEESATSTVMLRGKETITLDLPADVIPGSIRSEVKIYPSLLAHVIESIEAGLERPYGCGEQTISSTYPSLLLLKYYKKTGAPETATEKRARRYVQLGYQRLLKYHEPSGGFTYWGHGEADVALTAYAVRFLTELASVQEIDESVLTSAQQWLVNQQKDGMWRPRYGDNGALNAYVAWRIAESVKGMPESALRFSVREAVTKALQRLSDPHDPLREPYAIGSYAMANWANGDKGEAMRAAEQLRSLAHGEGSGTYWALETNTPFYGWGNAGRVETTALVVQALAAIDGSSEATQKVVDSGIVFLLKQKDRYGVWYSGQATVNVLEALISSLGRGGVANAPSIATITVNGKQVAQLELAPSNDQGPLAANISPYTVAGTNRIGIVVPSDAARLSVQTVATYYVPWKKESALEHVRTGDSHALRLGVSFDRTTAVIGEDVKCTVEAERVGHSGYGMMIAEVGLPPGAAVDRAVLDDLIKGSGWDFSRYEVLPDRVVLYLWPHAGGTKLTFSFRPRFGLKARSAASRLYDYYNPDAQVTLRPTDFEVRDGGSTARGQSGRQ